MRNKFFVLALTYQVATSTVTYEIDHLLKTAHGTSHAVKGKIVCAKPDQDCEFLFALGTASFESGNSSRDAHMKETVKEAAYPMAIVRGHIANLLDPKPLPVTSVEFAGKSADYTLSDFTAKKSGKGISLHAKLLLKLSSHNIERPSLLGASIKDEVPVDIQLELN